MMSYLFIFLLVVIFYYFFMIIRVLYRNFEKEKNNPLAVLETKSLMIVLGSGGHTTEMLHMLSTLHVEKYGRVTFVMGHSD